MRSAAPRFGGYAARKPGAVGNNWWCGSQVIRAPGGVMQNYLHNIGSG